MVDRRQIAKALLEIRAVEFRPYAPVRFKSGLISPVYVDNRRLIFHPMQWHTIIVGFVDLLASSDLPYDVIAGVAVGGIPHSTALAYQLQKPSVFVRKASKAHGKKKLIEGGDVQDLHVLLVEDLVTTGGSSLHAVENLIGAGAKVNTVLAIVNYGFEAAEQAFQQAAIRLLTLTDFEIILAVADELQLYSQDQLSIIHDWFQDPVTWMKRQ